MKALRGVVDGERVTVKQRVMRLIDLAQVLAAGAAPGTVLPFLPGCCMPGALIGTYQNDPRWAYVERRRAFVALGAEVTDPGSGTPVAGSWMRVPKMTRRPGWACVWRPEGGGGYILVAIGGAA
jgi:hypothetical protein